MWFEGSQDDEQVHSTVNELHSIRMTALKRLTQLCAQHVCHLEGVAPVEDAVILEQGPTYDPSELERGRYARLTASRIVLPQQGQGATVDVEAVLKRAGKSHLLQATHILKSEPPPQGEVDKVAAIFGVAKHEYQPIIMKMVQAGVAKLQTHKPRVINGIFGVLKNETEDRLIFDGRRCNLYFNEPEAVHLVSPTHLTHFWLQPDETLHFAKCDVSAMFHRLCAPEWMQTYFGLPPLEVDGVQKWPVLTALPMGFAHSVVIAAETHSQIVREALPDNFAQLRSPGIRKLNSEAPTWWFNYVDDEGIIGADEQQVRLGLMMSTAALNDEGLCVSEAKTVQPGDSPFIELLGLHITKEGWVRIKPKFMATLLNNTQSMRRQGSATPTQMSSLLGHWIWALLIRRPLLGVLQELFEICTRGKGRRHTLSEEQLDELQALMDIAPLLVADLRTTPSEVVMATDASSTGGGVAYTNIQRDEFVRLSEHSLQKGWSCSLGLGQQQNTPSTDDPLDDDQDADPTNSMPLQCDGLDDDVIVISDSETTVTTTTTTTNTTTTNTTTQSPTPQSDPRGRLLRPEDLELDYPEEVRRLTMERSWKTALATKWQFADHINILEAQAVLLGLRWLTTSSHHLSRRQAFLIDSTAVLGALVKGRSSAKRLNHLCRRIGALLVAADVTPLWLWVPSANNPADGPSRQHQP